MTKFLEVAIPIFAIATVLFVLLALATTLPSIIAEHTYLKPFIDYCSDHNWELWEFDHVKTSTPACLEIKDNLVIKHPLILIKDKVYEVKQ